MPFATTRRGGSPPASVRRMLLLSGAVLGCGSSELGVQQRLSGGEAYEGSNFYEGEGESTPSRPTVPDGVPGFVEFVSGEENLSACLLGTERERASQSGDASLVCPPAVSADISDFTFMGNPAGVTFGPDSSVPGGTFFYPADGLTSDVTAGDWHLTGTVSNVSGFGLYLSGCALLDASAHRGITFTLWGEVGAGGSLVFFTGTAANQVSHEWLSENATTAAERAEPPNLGRCVPVSNRYDGSCREPRATLVVSDTPTRVELLWRDLTEGCPVPTVDPREITTIAWYFPPAAGGPYAVDIHIDELRFTDVGPL